MIFYDDSLKSISNPPFYKMSSYRYDLYYNNPTLTNLTLTEVFSFVWSGCNIFWLFPLNVQPLVLLKCVLNN